LDGEAGTPVCCQAINIDAGSQKPKTPNTVTVDREVLNSTADRVEVIHRDADPITGDARGHVQRMKQPEM